MTLLLLFRGIGGPPPIPPRPEIGGGITWHKRRQRGLDTVIVTPALTFESINTEVIGKALIKKHIKSTKSTKNVYILNPIDVTKEIKALTLIDRKTEKTFTKGYMPFWSSVTTKSKLIAKHHSQSIKKSELEVEHKTAKSTKVKAFDVIHILRLIDKLNDVRKKKGKTPI